MKVKWNKEFLRYKTESGTYFKIDGDLTRVLQIKADDLSYALHWIRERLRKLENGQIKVVKGSSEGSRDWEQEEKIKRQMWEDINVNRFPEGIDFEDKIVYRQTVTDRVSDCRNFWHEQRMECRPPSPTCKLS